MYRHISDEELDRVINDFLVARGDEIVAAATSVHRAAAIGMPRAGRTQRLTVALLVALLIALLAAAGALVGSQLVSPAPPLTFAPGSIAFTRGGSLYVASADGNHEVEVAQGDLKTHQITSFAFAPSRRALAFSSASDGGAELVFVAPDGRTLGSRAFDNPDTAPWFSVPDTGGFSWAPDGDRLVMFPAAARPELSIVGLDGRVVRTLALPDGFSWGWVPDLTWSPDGRWITVHGCIQPCDTKYDPTILLVAADGSGWRGLTTQTAMTGNGVQVAWTPDSRLTLANGGGDTLEILATDGSTRQQVVMPGVQPGSLTWSADGARLAVGGTGALTVVESGTALTVVESDGSVRAVPIDRVLPQPTAGDDIAADIGEVGWSPDGAELLFIGNADASPLRSLYAIDPRGGTPRLLIEGVEGFDVASAR